MKLRDLGELGFIARLRQLGVARAEGTVRGVGDDAAVFRIGAGRVAVVTTDLLMEGVHFRFRRSTPATLGARCLTASLSDIAAMGATPREAFLSLAAPPGIDADALFQLVSGLHAEAARHDVNLLGGDTCGSSAGLVVSVTVVGEAEEGSLVYRSGADAGDRLYVTGDLGDAALGLRLLEGGFEASSPHHRHLVSAHEAPRAHLAESALIAASGAARAMIDLSDGLATDLGHILDAAGGLGATLDESALPVSDALCAVSRELDVEPTELALGGGEDYVLLVAVGESAAEGLERTFLERFGRQLARVGRVEEEAGIRLRNGGVVREFRGAGYEHFRR